MMPVNVGASIRAKASRPRCPPEFFEQGHDFAVTQLREVGVMGADGWDSPDEVKRKSKCC